MKHQRIAKLVLLLVYPAIAALLALATLAVILLGWFAIPFAECKRKPDGDGYEIVFPWGEDR